jgi:hypothetical protein
MKSLKKTLALVLVLVLSLSIIPAELLPTARAASPFSDIAGHWAQGAIEELAGKGIINGMGDGTYNPNGAVTREQFIKLVVSVRGVSDGAATDTFYDVPGDSWSNPFVAEGLNRGLFSLSETDGHYFAPASPMDRDTVALWITRAVGLGGTSDATTFADNNSITNKGAVAVAVAEGLVTGYENNTFRPRNTLTRAESAVLIQRLIAKDEELNSPVEEHSEIVLQDGVIKIEPAAGADKLVSSDEETGRYLFENISEDIRELKADDIFVIYPCPSVPEGIAIKVDDIKIDGNTAEIWNAGVELGDVVEKLDSSGSTPITSANIDVASLPEGLTLMSQNELAVEVVPLANVGDMAPNPALTVTSLNGQAVEETKDEARNVIPLAGVGDLSPNPALGVGFKVDDLKITENIYVSGSIWIEASAVHDIDYDIWRDGLNPRKIEFYMQRKDTFNIKGSVKKSTKIGEGEAYHDDLGNRGNIFGDTTSYDWARSITSNSTKKQKENYDKKLATISVPVGATGLCVYGSFFIGITVEGEIYLEFKYEQLQKSGFRYQNGQISQLKETEKELSASLGLEGKIEFGLKAELGVTFLKIVNVSINVKGGIGLKGSMEALSVGYDFSDSSTSDAVVGSETKTDSHGNITEFHDCLLCIDGDIYLYLDIGAQVGIVNIPKLLKKEGRLNLFEASWRILDENNAKFMDFYVSVRPISVSADPPQAQFGQIEIGLTECPHIYKAPEITKQPQGQTVSAGKDVEFSIMAKNESNKNKQTNTTGAGLSYDWYKDGVKVEGGVGNNKLTKGAVTETDAGQYYCVVYLTDCPELKVQSNTVTLTVNPADPPEIGAEFEQPPDGETSGEDKGGDFGVIVPEF